MLQKSNICGFVIAVLASFFVINFPAIADGMKMPENANNAIFNFKNESFSRPSNFYKLEESKDVDICKYVLEKINEPRINKPNYWEGYFGILTNNSTTLPMEEIKSENGGGQVFVITHDINNDGKLEWLYKFFWTMSHRYIASIVINEKKIDEKAISSGVLYKYADRSKIFYDRLYKQKIDYSKIMSPDLGFIVFENKLILLSGEDDSYHLCKKAYDVYAFNVDSKENELPICHFRSKAKVICKK